MKRGGEVVALALLWTVLCLLIGGMSGCRDKRPEALDVEDTIKLECKLVVGTTWTDSRVWRCYDPLTGKCFLLANNGGILEVPCADHPIAEVDR